jgi:hypothetical protein
MSIWSGWKFGMFCVVVTGAIAAGRAQTAGSKPTNEALTFNGEGGRRFKGIFAGWLSPGAGRRDAGLQDRLLDFCSSVTGVDLPS